MYYVYVLRSLIDNKLYIGQTINPDIRLKQHNNGKVLSTKNRKPFILIYKEEFNSRIKAVKREKFFKTHKGYNFLKSLGLYGD